MPIVGFKCADKAKTRNKGDVTFDECLECSNTMEHKCQFTYPILKGIVKEIQNRNYISVTSLLGCARNTYLEQKHDIYVSPEDLYHLFRGTIAHYIVEHNQPKGALVEHKFERDHNGMTLTGTPDVVLPYQSAIIDYKTATKVPTFKYPYSNHTMQLNLYRWLVAEKYDIEHLEVQYLDMKTPKRCEAKIKEEETLELLDSKLTTLEACFSLEQAPPKPPADSPDRWQCNGYCNVQKQCEELWEDEIRCVVIEDLRLKG